LSRRIRIVSHDESLWQKLNLCKQVIPREFLEMAINNGCKYLSLQESVITGSLKLNTPCKLKYLDLTFIRQKRAEEILKSCRNLKKLSLDYLQISSSIVDNICNENWKTLEVLNVEERWDLEALKLVVNKCRELKELNLSRLSFTNEALDFLVNNITTKIEKLSLSCYDLFAFSGPQVAVNDQQIDLLVKRCQNISSLDLSGVAIFANGEITDNGITSIIEHLKSTLEELDISNCERISSMKQIELTKLPHLKVL